MPGSPSPSRGRTSCSHIARGQIALTSCSRKAGKAAPGIQFVKGQLAPLIDGTALRGWAAAAMAVDGEGSGREHRTCERWRGPSNSDGRRPRGAVLLSRLALVGVARGHGSPQMRRRFGSPRQSAGSKPVAICESRSFGQRSLDLDGWVGSNCAKPGYGRCGSLVLRSREARLVSLLTRHVQDLVGAFALGLNAGKP